MGRMNPEWKSPSECPVALDGPGEFFPQHLVVTEFFLVVPDSVLATSNLRVSPDDRMSSLPLQRIEERKIKLKQWEKG